MSENNSSSIYTGNPNPNNLEAGLNPSGNSLNSSGSSQGTMQLSELGISSSSRGHTTRESFPTSSTNSSNPADMGYWSAPQPQQTPPNITGNTTPDSNSSSFGIVSGLNLGDRSMSLPLNNSIITAGSNNQYDPFPSSFSTIGSDNNNSSIVGNPTGVMINRRRPPRTASSPINNSNNNKSLGGKKKRKTKKVNRKQKKTKKVKRKVKKTMKKKQRKTKRKTRK